MSRCIHRFNSAETMAADARACFSGSFEHRIASQLKHTAGINSRRTVTEYRERLCLDGKYATGTDDDMIDVYSFKK